MVARYAAVGALLVVGAHCVPAPAEDPGYVLSLTDGVAVSGASVVVDVTLDNMGGDIQGFNIDVCHDGQALDPTALTLGPALQALNGGAGRDFVAVYLQAPGGVVLGMVFSFMGLDVLPPALYAPLYTITYGVLAETSVDTEPCFCDIPACQGCPIADAIFLLQYINGAGPPPPPQRPARCCRGSRPDPPPTPVARANSSSARSGCR